jgi:hypothetical protein
MDVVGHQDVRVDPATGRHCGVAQRLLIPQVVDAAMEAWLAIVAALNDVLRDPCEV